MAWLMLLIPSAMTGALCAALIKHERSKLLAGALPVFGLFCALIYTVYLGPSADGGDGLWIIALIFGGAIAAFTSITTFRIVKNITHTTDS